MCDKRVTHCSSYHMKVVLPTTAYITPYAQVMLNLSVCFCGYQGLQLICYLNTIKFAYFIQ